MSIKKYSEKRNFKNTPEPHGHSGKHPHTLRFVVQKHAARHLHYDFRLEYRDVLLSWAVPKGPSLDPKDKRLAIQVEDHPLDYQHFEGTIPKGNYGAGTVEIWDHGSYTSHGATSPKEIERHLTEGLAKGHFAVTLSGEKLNGDFVFQKLKRDPNSKEWLLIKKEDANASSEAALKPPHKEKVAIKKSPVPQAITPMLATLAEDAFDDDDWIFEIKWDGYRTLAYVDHGHVTLQSRSHQLWTDKFPAVVSALKKINRQAILDGELVVLDENGRADFQSMQNYMKSGEGTLCYYVFDLLYDDGQDLRDCPLIERKTRLKEILDRLDGSLIRFSDHVIAQGKKFFQLTVDHQLEGMIGKKADSVYQQRRSPDWVKVKTSLRQEVVIGGFTAPRGSRQGFGALLVGVYNDAKELVYCGHVGGGFNEKLLEDTAKTLKALVRKACPFAVEPKANEVVTWVKPELVCEVSFAEWTREGVMRQPIFHGFRIDKPAKAVKKEVVTPPAEVKKPRKAKAASSSLVELTHLDKVYWPKEKITKGDLLNYYEGLAPTILPYLKNRPIVLHRYPQGIDGEDFYQKDLAAHPDWIQTVAVQHEGKVVHYLLIDDVNSLLYAVNLGSIDLHPCMARCDHLDTPDYCVIDIDPRDIAFEAAVEVALTAHEILDQAGVKHYCKTSGGKGLHLLIPLHGKYSYEQSRQFAQVIGHELHERLPKTTSLERDPKKRMKKVYIDCLQNRYMQTIVAPYAVRPRPLAMVSTPLEWSEVTLDLDPTAFTIHTVPKRLKKVGELFKPVLGAGVNLKAVMQRWPTLIATS